MGALEAECSSFESSLGELGGGASGTGAGSDVATEDLVAMLDEMGVQTGIEPALVIDAARSMQAVLRRRLASRTPAVGPVAWSARPGKRARDARATGLALPTAPPGLWSAAATTRSCACES